MNNNIINSDESRLLDEMQADYLKGPAIYHVSKYWENLNQLNVEWLEKDGINNFKRSINNNYFNWTGTIRSSYFRNMLRHFFTKNIKHPIKLISAIFTKLDGDMVYRTPGLPEKSYPTFLQRKLYALYLRFLYDFVFDLDDLGLFTRIEEPQIGNPITIRYKNKHISQDISNSYLEYLYLRKTMGQNFSNLRTICEIGSGYGRLSFLLSKLCAGNNAKLILVDIPPALFIAQWYLQRTIPEAKIFAYRDFDSFNEFEEEFEKAGVCFLLPHQLALLPDKYIDLVINISSFHEMKLDQIKHYYEIIHKKAKYLYTKQWLYWENPADKVAMPAVIYPTKPEWQLIDARLHPVHKDFFEAVFKLNLS